MRKIYCRLAVLMAEKDPKLTQLKLAEETKLAGTTIARMINNTFARTDNHTVEVLCDYFKCELSDLLVLREAPKE